VGCVQYGLCRVFMQCSCMHFSALLHWRVISSWFAVGAFDAARAGTTVGAPCLSHGRLEGCQRRQLGGIQAIQPLQGEGAGRGEDRRGVLRPVVAAFTRHCWGSSAGRGAVQVGSASEVSARVWHP
jgi:hypothetical protein